MISRLPLFVGAARRLFPPGISAGLVAAIALLALPPQCRALQADLYRGLWVGQVTLNYVSEVTVPLDTNNVPIAPDPEVPTPTYDQANLRLILHVSGAGQVSLLKDVAILDRQSETNTSKTESDLALVTDERLYGEFRPQPAVRIASAAFDFGDSKATEAVDALVEAVVDAVDASLATNTADLNTAAGRASAAAAATQAGELAAAPVVANANVATAFDAFLRGSDFNRSAVNDIAKDTDPEAAAQTALNAATDLQNQSFYSDSRAVDMVHSVLAAIESAGTDSSERMAAAQNAAAAFADLSDNYDRFIAGKLMGDMIAGAAVAAGQAATNGGSLEEILTTVSNAVDTATFVNEARAEAIRLAVPLYDDTRAADAVEQVLGEIITEATAVGVTNNFEEAIRSAADQAGRDALATMVARYPVAFQPPTTSYLEFVTSSSFAAGASTAAAAAAAGAIAEKRDNALATPDSIARAARLAAVDALGDVYAAAAGAVRTELPMVGTFGPGLGDPRLTWVMRQTNATATLGPAALTATIYLPANHPTNPFRHRRHPDHTTGFDVTRRIRLDFNGDTASTLARAGYGVDRITGTYREEIFGLHKPLGPEKNVGLRVEGTFELNRISLIDALNAR